MPSSAYDVGVPAIQAGAAPPASAAVGQLYLNLNNTTVYCYDGKEWRPLAEGQSMRIIKGRCPECGSNNLGVLKGKGGEYLVCTRCDAVLDSFSNEELVLSPRTKAPELEPPTVPVLRLDLDD